MAWASLRASLTPDPPRYDPAAFTELAPLFCRASHPDYQPGGALPLSASAIPITDGTQVFSPSQGKVGWDCGAGCGGMHAEMYVTCQNCRLSCPPHGTLGAACLSKRALHFTDVVGAEDALSCS